MTANTDAAAERILAGDLRALARAASAVENRLPHSDDLLRRLFPHTGRAITLGITGSPGAGKSTLTNQLVRTLRNEGKSVAVIAVDPSSPYSGGAILGDRIRMQDHHGDPGVFIRSMATRGAMGGLAAATADMALLFDAAGRDYVLLETVGVGQDEVDVARLADVTAVVLVPGMGDDVQAIKAGIMEIGDVLIINKADQAGADKLQREIEAALSLGHGRDGWEPPVVRTVANEGQGVGDALAAMRRFIKEGRHRHKARAQWSYRLREMFRARLLEALPSAEVESAAAAVATRDKDPYTIVHEWIQRVSY